MRNLGLLLGAVFLVAGVAGCEYPGPSGCTRAGCSRPSYPATGYGTAGPPPEPSTSYYEHAKAGYFCNHVGDWGHDSAGAVLQCQKDSDKRLRWHATWTTPAE